MVMLGGFLEIILTFYVTQGDVSGFEKCLARFVTGTSFLFIIRQGLMVFF